MIPTGDPQLYNDDLRPTEPRERTWTWLNYSTVWMGMVHNIVAYTTAAGLIALGMNVWQALVTVLTANAILILAMCANGVAGAKYGLPFPVLMRATFGYRGAQFPVLVRAAVAMFWFAAQTYAGSLAINAIIGAVVPAWNHLGSTQFIGMGLGNWISFVIFWALHVVIIRHGMVRVRFFELWAGPLVVVMLLGLVVWAIHQAHGLGPLFSQPAKVHGHAFWVLFGASVTGLIGTWSTLVLNIPDFTRFSRSQRDQTIGQTIGLPITALLFSFMSILITSGTVAAFGHPIANPVDLLIRMHSTPVLILGAVALLIATLSVNVAANIVSPAYDLVHLFPRRLTFVSAGIIATVLAVGAVPWLWFSDAARIFKVLNVIGGALGPVAGIMLVDFFVLRRRSYDIGSFYSRSGEYSYRDGWNVRGLLALAVGLFAALAGNVIPGLGGLANYAWFIGLAVGGVAYYLAMAPDASVVSAREVASAAEAAEGVEPAGARLELRT
ncbi:MAG TPA: NCS1 family nucleobase:cation symporter-1 [Solirubrobacteraceae bacterium]|nr:NCS1 family nucleobase:cation symporter-1 [Solirubrobacteraceae bacterium]